MNALFSSMVFRYGILTIFLFGGVIWYLRTRAARRVSARERGRVTNSGDSKTVQRIGAGICFALALFSVGVGASFFRELSTLGETGIDVRATVSEIGDVRTISDLHINGARKAGRIEYDHSFVLSFENSGVTHEVPWRTRTRSEEDPYVLGEVIPAVVDDLEYPTTIQGATTTALLYIDAYATAGFFFLLATGLIALGIWSLRRQLNHFVNTSREPEDRSPLTVDDVIHGDWQVTSRPKK